MIYNILFSILSLVYGVYEIYDSYTKPAKYFSTDIKGYLGGISLIVLSILSLKGDFNMLETCIEILKDIFEVLINFF